MTGAWLPDDVPIRSRLVEQSWGRTFLADVGPSIRADGSGEPPLLCLHGLFVTHYVFSKATPHLAGERRMLMPDLPGCGDSDHLDPEASGCSLGFLANSLAELLTALDVATCDVIGYDFGGAVALALAAAEPKRVRKLVLCGPLALTATIPLPGTLALAPTVGPEIFGRALRRADVRTWLQGALSTPELLEPAALDVYWDRLGRRGGLEALHGYLRQVGQVARLRDQLSSVDAPTLIVSGDRDLIVPIEQCERLAELLPDARCEMLDGCGHDPFTERPEAVAVMIAEHCREAG